MSRATHRAISIRATLGCAVALCLTVPAIVRAADKPLHVRIDQVAAKDAVGPSASGVSDAGFLRRVTLDLHGMIPTADAARKFLDDPSPNKRTELVDRLLADPQYARHMAVVFDVMLMERRPETVIKTPAWREYLRSSFAANKPYDQLVAEILTNDGTDPATRPIARFILDRDAEAHLLTRDVGRILLGRDMQCAQCHDSPAVSDYLQRDYYGLYAFFNRSGLFPEKTPTTTTTDFTLAEKSDGDVTFKSVFTGEAGATRPRMPGQWQLAEPFHAPGEDYVVPPGDKARSVPKYSRRAQLPAELTSSGAELFQRNIANRLWAHLFGRGLVHPLDLHHSSNPPTNPELLDLLAHEFAAMRYDVKGFLRELVLSETYQRSIDVPAELARSAADAPARLTTLQAEHNTTQKLAGEADKVIEPIVAERTAAAEESGKIATELATARSAITEVLKKQAEADKALADATAPLAAKQELAALVSQSSELAQSALAKLPGDEALAQAAAAMKAKSDAIAAEVAALTKTRDEKQTAATAVAADVSAAKEKATGIAARLATVDQSVTAIEARLAAADAHAKHQHAEVHHLDKQIATTQKLVEFGQQLAAAQQAQQEVAFISNQLIDATRRGQELAALLPAAMTTSSGAVADVSTNGATLSMASLMEESQTAQGQVQELSAKLAAAVERSNAARQTVDLSVDTLSNEWSTQFLVGNLKPLTPEQMAWSVMLATGVYERQRPAARAELDKAAPMTDADRADAQKVAAREQAVDDKAFEQLQGNVDRFVRLFGAAGGQPQGDFFATADQALFFANDGLMLSWITPSGGSLTERLIKVEDPRTLADELYLAILTRRPTEVETADVAGYLQTNSNRAAAVQDAVWALVTSAEFRFNQ